LREKSAFLIFILFWCGTALAADAAKVMVFPLSVPAGNKALSWLGDGIASSLSSQLAGPGIRIVNRDERTALVEGMDLPPGAQLSHASMIRAAQRASADLAIMGSCTGTEQNLRISVRALDIKRLKFSGEMVANGSISVLPQLENELAWLILSNAGLEKGPSREKFRERMRKIPNSAFAAYIQGLEAPGESEQLHLLLRASEMYHNFPEAQLRIGHLYFRKRDCGRAVPHLLIAEAASTFPTEGDFMLGTCYLQENQVPQAIQFLSRLLQVVRPFEVLNNIGVAYLRKGDNTLALNTLLEAGNLAKTDPAPLLNLAIARHLQGDDPVALNVLEDAVKSSPNDGMLLFVQGFLLKNGGEGEKGERLLIRARDLGINVDQLQQADPRTWARLLWTWPPQKAS
jgi:Flp pilus assembly protein TadD/TolB-like protein